jgi:hypothetical protein
MNVSNESLPVTVKIFCGGINNTTANISPHTVAGITEHVRDRLRQEYGLREEEIV